MIKSTIVLLICILSTAISHADDLILFEDFEDSELGSGPEGWEADANAIMEVVDDPVKNSERSLKIENRIDEQDAWFEFGREVKTVSIEFWIFPSTSRRTLSLLLLNGSVERGEAGPYMGWASLTPGFIDKYTGGWSSTGVKFADNEWTYVKVVADATRSPKSYDFYLGEGPDKLPEEPQGKNVGYRNTGLSAFDRVLFLGWSDTAGPGYIDDILIYEGTERPAGVFKGVSVESVGKLAGKWGEIKSR